MFLFCLCLPLRASEPAPPVEITMKDAGNGVISLKNNMPDTNLGELDASWIILENGHRTDIAVIEGLNVEPGGNAFLEVPYRSKPYRFGGERWLRIDFRARQPESGPREGELVASRQFELPATSSPPPKPFEMGNLPAIELVESPSHVIVKNSLFNIRFDKKTGAADYIVYYDENRIARAPDGLSGPALCLAESGLPANSITQVLSVEAGQVNTNKVRITFHCLHYFTLDAALDQVSVYTIYGNGAVRMDNYCRRIAESFKDGIGRVGIQMSLSPKFDKMDFYGSIAADTEAALSMPVQIYKHGFKDSTGIELEEVRWLGMGDKFCRGMMILTRTAPFAAAISVYEQSGCKRLRIVHSQPAENGHFSTLFLRRYDSVLLVADRLWYAEYPEEKYEIPAVPAEVPFIPIKDLPSPYRTITASSEENKPNAKKKKSKINLARHGFDGNPETRWAVALRGKKHWYQIQLLETRRIKGVKILWQHPERPYQYIVETSIDGEKWEKFVDHTHRNRITPLAEHYFDATARFVRITFLGGPWPSFYELDIIE